MDCSPPPRSQRRGKSSSGLSLSLCPPLPPGIGILCSLEERKYTNNTFLQELGIFFDIFHLRQYPSPSHDYDQLPNIGNVGDRPQAMIHHDLLQVRVQHHDLLRRDEQVHLGAWLIFPLRCLEMKTMSGCF